MGPQADYLHVPLPPPHHHQLLQQLRHLLCQGIRYYFKDFIFNRPGVAVAVLQTPLSLIDQLIQRLTDPFPPNLQDTFIPKQ